MNHIYRLVYNRALCVMQVASELARPRSGGSGRSARSIRRRQRRQNARNAAWRRAALLGSGTALVLAFGIAQTAWATPGSGDAKRTIWAPHWLSTPTYGGDGTWTTTSQTWVGPPSSGTNGPSDLTPPDGFALFKGNPGTVTIDNSNGIVSVSGLHFAVDGYKLIGDPLTLVPGKDGGTPIIRVGTDAGDAMTATISNALTGNDGLKKTDGGTLVLTNNDNNWSGGTTISGGTLKIGNGSTGSIGSGEIVDNGRLVFDLGHEYTLANDISGNGTLKQIGGSTLILNGDSDSFTGSTHVLDGTLIVGGGASGLFNLGGTSEISAKLGGDVDVADGATLGGQGTIGGLVTIEAGAIFTPGGGDSVGTTTVGSLHLTTGSVLDFELAGIVIRNAPVRSDHITVTGKLTFDGGGTVLKLTDAGGLANHAGPGLYNLIEYGSLATTNCSFSGGNACIDIGATPSGMPANDYIILNDDTVNQIDLYTSQGQKLNLWMGSDATARGGNGTWTNASKTWRHFVNGDLTKPGQMTEPGFAIFGGEPGTVTVSQSVGPIGATGMQFAVDGYTLQGDTLTLVGTTANGPNDTVTKAPIIRVGDGTGAGMTATIANVLAGDDGVKKTGAGTLVLTADNTFTGGLVLSAGTVSVARDASLGHAGGKLIFRGGTLKNTAAFASARDVILKGGLPLPVIGDASLPGGTFVTEAEMTLSGKISGGGRLVKQGTGKLILTGDHNTWGRGDTLFDEPRKISDIVFGASTFIRAGTLQIGNGGTGSIGIGGIWDNSKLVFDLSHDYTLANGVSGSGKVIQKGSGTLTYTGSNDGPGWYVDDATLAVRGDKKDYGHIVGGKRAAVSVRNAGRLVVGQYGFVEGGEGTKGHHAGAAGVYATGSAVIGNHGHPNFKGGKNYNNYQAGGISGGDGADVSLGVAGAGGAGVTGAGFMLTNHGKIQGGVGGKSDPPPGASGAGTYVGGTGGAGVAGSGFTLTNAAVKHVTTNGGAYYKGGAIVGGDGGSGVTAGAGGAGVTGSGFKAANHGRIIGGEGGEALGGDPTGPFSGTAGEGGAGVSGSDFMLANAAGDPDSSSEDFTDGGLIQGGAGGDGYHAGDGGTGISGNNFTLVNAPARPDSTSGKGYAGGGVIRGGDGGYGYHAGDGGAGVSGSGFELVNMSTGNSGSIPPLARTAIRGGQGGDGAIGGAGGPGIKATNTTIYNGGFIYGGDGGDSSGQGHDGGAGGAGIRAINTTIHNAGLIKGGAGGDGTDGGVGGVGVVSTGGSTVFNTGTIAGGVSGANQNPIRANAVHFSGGSNTLVLKKGYTFIGNVISTSGTTGGGDTLALGGGGDGHFDVSHLVANNPTTWTGTVQYYGFATYAKTGAGTRILSGRTQVNTPWTVKNGALIVGGDQAHTDAAIAGPVTVLPGGTLGGYGSVGAVTNFGTVSPGNSTGTLTVDGNYIAKTGSVYKVEVAADGSDMMEVKGRAKLNGKGRVKVVIKQPDDKPGSTYKILKAKGGIKGRFADITTRGPLFYAKPLYAPNALMLTMLKNNNRFPKIARTPNQRATANAVVSLGPGNPLYASLSSLSAPKLRSAFNDLSGEYYASSATALFANSRYVRTAVSNRMARHCGGNSRADQSTDDMANAPCHHSVWLQAYGNWGQYDGNGNAAGLDYQAGGLSLGADTQLAPGVRVGFVLGYGHTVMEVDARNSSGSADSYRLGVYGGLDRGDFSLMAGVVHAWHVLESTRHIHYRGTNETVNGDYNAQSTQIFAEAGYRIDLGANSLKPFVRGAYVHLDTDGFTEDGGNAALTVDGQSRNLGLSLVGIRLNSVLSSGPTRVRFHGLIGWQHIYGETTPEATVALAGSQPYTVEGVPLPENALAIQAGASFAVRSNVTIGASYVGRFGDGFTANGIEANLTWQF